VEAEIARDIGCLRPWLPSISAALSSPASDAILRLRPGEEGLDWESRLVTCSRYVNGEANPSTAVFERGPRKINRACSV
jgi:hypothetical protein